MLKINAENCIYSENAQMPYGREKVIKQKKLLLELGRI